MSSTNKTTNYNLSQFVGADKPAWLADYNQDMSKIDAGMHTNAAAIETANGNITTNTNAIGTLPNLNTTIKTDLVSSINETYNIASVADGTAQAAATNANTAKTEADALTRYLAITNTAKATATVTGGTIGNINDLYYALNADGTLGKIYGRFRFTTTTTSATTVTISVPGLNVSSAFTIAGGCYYTSLKDGDWNLIGARDMQVNANNTVTITMPANPILGTSYTLWLPPCLYFFTDFGDVINPGA